jgi:hypothetical protein
MEGAGFTPITVAQCFADIDQAHVQAIAIAQAEHPTLIARTTACEATGCPSTDEGAS